MDLFSSILSYNKMSRNMFNHSYSPYDGRPYIFYNGVPVDREHLRDCGEEHPPRTIIRSNHHHHMVDHVPTNGMGKLVALAKIKEMITGDPYALYIRNCNYSANNLFP
jgi:hypothetical protein